ncbi:hypothetical protein EW146_g3860 [Bondarzewia mesenterica]|uniref:Uncharacterized protein n=1 Tax=Bondarzewia mesenterica TaxID=1095465 RepID=A0A4S4LWB0_9AGAM|nr:hypothetical protein EW146_g3860 [Bondarzewia mesenterica]
MNTTVTEPPEVIQHVGLVIRANVIVALATTLFYGFFCILICYSSCLLLRKGLKSRANLILLAVTLVMFASSICYWGLELAALIKQIQIILIYHRDHTLESKFSTANDFLGPISTGRQLMLTIVYLLSDTIVVWRAWVLYPNNRKPVIATVGLLICATGFIIKSDFPNLNSTNYATTGWTSMSTFLLEVMANVMATLLIGYKAWKHHQEIKNNLGIIYCFIWISYIIMDFKGIVNADVLSGVCTQIAGIYPTIIVVLVSHQNTVWEMLGIPITADHNGQSLSMPQFAAAPQPRHSITTEGQVQSRVSIMQLHSYQSMDGPGIAEVARVEKGLKDEGALV